MSDRQIRDEIFTIFLAGYESTASAISWCCHLLTRNPDVRTRLRAEIGHLDHTRTPGFADLPDLPYGRRVIDETLRLFPAFPMYFRTSVGVDTIGPYRLPGKAKIVVSPYATHRDPRFWTEPTRFDPDRFSSDRFDAAARGAYYPFGKGNRVCVGERMSVVIAQVVVSAIVHGFDFEPAPGAVVEGRYAMSYQPRNGLPLILTAR